MKDVKRRLLLLALSLLALGNDSPAQTSNDHFARAVQLQQKGDLDGARRAYEQALKLSPGRIDALSNLALVYLNLGRPQEAIPGLKKAQTAAPGHPGILYFLGLAYFQTEQFLEAENELAKVVAAQPENHKARHLYGLCLLKQNKLNEGIRALEKVVHADSGNLSAAYTLGSAYVKTRQIDKAEQLVNDVLEPADTPQSNLIIGSVQLAKRDYQGALETLRKLQQADTKLPLLHSQLGVAYLYVGYTDRAKQEFQAELSINPNDYNANAFLGWLSHRDGNSERAEKLLRRAYRMNETDSGLQYLLAQVHQSRREWEAARKLLEKVVAKQPDFTPAHVMLARVYAKLKRVDDFRREKEIIARLNAEQQEKDLQGVDQLYEGTILTMPPAGERQKAPSRSK